MLCHGTSEQHVDRHVAFNEVSNVELSIDTLHDPFLELSALAPAADLLDGLEEGVLEGDGALQTPLEHRYHVCIYLARDLILGVDLVDDSVKAR